MSKRIGIIRALAARRPREHGRLCQTDRSSRRRAGTPPAQTAPAAGDRPSPSDGRLQRPCRVDPRRGRGRRPDRRAARGGPGDRRRHGPRRRYPGGPRRGARDRGAADGRGERRGRPAQAPAKSRPATARKRSSRPTIEHEGARSSPGLRAPPTSTPPPALSEAVPDLR